jgi:hypothetical protein
VKPRQWRVEVVKEVARGDKRVRIRGRPSGKGWKTGEQEKCGIRGAQEKQKRQAKEEKGKGGQKKRRANEAAGKRSGGQKQRREWAKEGEDEGRGRTKGGMSKVQFNGGESRRQNSRRTRDTVS